MKTAKERLKILQDLIGDNNVPDGCDVRLWINKCTKKELLEIGAENEVLCDQTQSGDLFLCLENNNYEITLWEK